MNKEIFKIREATIKDLERVSSIEKSCFPPAEAASEERFKERLEVYPQYFWLVEKDDVMVGFVNGPVINQNIIDDEMYGNASCHDSAGLWQTVFGINTLPEYRKQGIGALMMEAVIARGREEGRKGCVLTCKDHMKPFYESFGFVSMGESASSHGGAKWNDMVLEY